MGIFGKRASREERAAKIAGQVADGKGFYGRASRAVLGGADFARLQQSVGTFNSGQQVARLLAAGVPTTPAAVVSVADTGRMINFDPVVDLVVRPAGAEDTVTLRTLVSKLRIPRPGDRVALIADPSHPGGYLYAGDGGTP